MKGFWDKAQKYPYLSDSEADGIAYVDIDGKMMYIPVKGDFVKAWTPEIMDKLDGFLDDYFEAITEGEARRLELFPEPKTIGELHQTFKHYLEIDPDDLEIIDIVLAAACDRRIQSDPAWLQLIGPPGSFKTELLRALRGIPDIYSLDSLTPQTLISGKVEKNKRGEFEPIAGILRHLDQKTLVVKDFTVVLTMREESRQEILSQLRAAHDGYLEKAFGTLPEPIRIPATFGLIIGVTPAIDKYVKTQVTLGERFLKVRVHSGGRTITARRALENLGTEEKMRTALSSAVEYLINHTDFKILKLTPKQTTQIVNLALYTATMRTHVWAKFYRGEIIDLEPPTIEFPTRVSKQLAKIGFLIANIRGHQQLEPQDMKVIRRLARDNAPPIRQKIIDYFAEQGLDHQAKTYQISQDLNLNWTSAQAILEKMQALKILKSERKETITQTAEGAKHTFGQAKWTIHPDFKKLIKSGNFYLTTTEGTTIDAYEDSENPQATSYGSQIEILQGLEE